MSHLAVVATTDLELSTQDVDVTDQVEVGELAPDAARRNSPELLIEIPHPGFVLDASRCLLTVGVCVARAWCDRSR